MALPEGVNLITADAPTIDFANHGLSRDIPDDHLIASCLSFRATEREVVLVAHDTGPLIKAAKRGVRVMELPDRYLLPDALDSVEK